MRYAVLVLALTLAGCGGSSSGTTAPPPSTRTTSAASHDSRLAARAAHYLTANFQGTTWLGDVKRIKMRDGEMFVVTDIYPDSDADAPSRSICTALRFWPPAPTTVHIVSSTGKWTGC